MNLEGIKQHLSNNGSRWLVAIVLLLIVTPGLVMDDHLYFCLIVLLAGGVTWWEFSRNLFGADRVGLMTLALAGWLAVAVGAFIGPEYQILGLVVALVLGVGYGLWVLERESGPVLVNLLGRLALGHLYLSLLMSFFLSLIKVDHGRLWVAYVLVATIAADTGAYYVGRKYQGPKLAPKISPNKTVSGLVGGAVAAMLVSGLFSVVLPSGAGLWAMLPLGLFLGFWGAVGDLFESAVKRAIEIKDSSRLLAGHGGFWDRLDSLLFNVVVVYFLVELTSINTSPPSEDLVGLVLNLSESCIKIMEFGLV